MTKEFALSVKPLNQTNITVLHYHKTSKVTMPLDSGNVKTVSGYTSQKGYTTFLLPFHSFPLLKNSQYVQM